MSVSTTEPCGAARLPDNSWAIGVIGPVSATRQRATRALAAAGDVTSITATEAAAMPTPQLDAAVICGVDRGELLDAVRRAREDLPGCPLVALWPSDGPVGDLRRVVRAGANGLVNESELESTLWATIAAVCAGFTCVPQHARGLFEEESLSMREKQVLGMIVRGCTNAEIAQRLFLAESTVKSHLSAAYTKLGVRSRKAATAMILDPDEGLGPGILNISAA